MLAPRFARFAEQISPAAAAAAAGFGRKPLPGVGRIIAISSCKGGVGKSTVSINTALALSKKGMKVGLFDADVYGPTIPTMSNTSTNPLYADADANFIPIESHGVESVSIGNCIEREAALLWKGPMVSKIISELLRKAQWSPLDYLIIDTPPGTGDVPMALQVTIPIDGALLVTSPQKISTEEVSRSLDMFQKWKVPVLGIVQNFDGFVCEHCKNKSTLFPGNGAQQISKHYGIDFVASVPVDPAVAVACDKGVPAVIAAPESAFSKSFDDIATMVMTKLPKTVPKIPAKPRKAVASKAK